MLAPACYLMTLWLNMSPAGTRLRRCVRFRCPTAASFTSRVIPCRWRKRSARSCSTQALMSTRGRACEMDLAATASEVRPCHGMQRGAAGLCMPACQWSLQASAAGPWGALQHRTEAQSTRVQTSQQLRHEAAVRSPSQGALTVSVQEMTGT